MITRWNSFYDAIKKIIHCREKVTECFDELKICRLKPIEWKFLEEYVQVMMPLTTALDKLQGEKSCYLGYVAPTIIALKHILMSKSNLVYCKPLSICIIKSIEKRYHFLFNLNDQKSKPYILSSVSHPKFKLNWVPTQYSETCKNIFLSECHEINSNMNIEVELLTSDHDSGDEFYNSLISSSQSTNSSSGSENLASVQGLSFLNSKKNGRDLKILDNYPIIKQIFFKYNTTLPSSAPVERMFSSGSQILIPRRNRLSDHIFNMLICLKSKYKENNE